MKELTATLFDIYRGTTHDGPGLRDTVFFSTCPLSCGWCHNPEGLLKENRVWHEPKTCIGCMSCKEVCHANAIEDGATNLIINTDLCDNCHSCVKECPTKSLTLVQKTWTLSELERAILKDLEYFKSSGGGVTVSGGECLMQHEFVGEFLRRMRQNGVHTAVDTCGCVASDVFREVLEACDCLLYDLKFMDGDLHKKFTGVDNKLILENALIAAKHKESNKDHFDMWIRTPLIPGATATVENIKAIGDFIAEHLGGAVSRWEMCGFNNVCASKYQRLNVDWAYKDVPMITRTYANELLEVAKATGAADGEVYVTGIISEQ